MYQVIKETKMSSGLIKHELISEHKKEEHAENKRNRIAGNGFSECWGVTYKVVKI